MERGEFDIVTGAFGYTGRHIAQRLLAKGHRVKTLTGHPDRPNPLGEQIEVAPFNFDRPRELVESMRGAGVLYNTYWIRFEKGEKTFDQAVRESKVLFLAAREAGVSRIVHISIANPSCRRDLKYYAGKAELEDFLKQFPLTYAFVRPTVLFGDEGILINNIAWLLRHLPIFAVPGSGEYGIQPVHVDDVARIATEAGAIDGNVIVDAVGPETYTFNELVRLLRQVVHSHAKILHVPPRLMYWMSKPLGIALNDVMLTWEEIQGLMAGLLASSNPPTGRIRLSEWLGEHAQTIGANYASEIKRHYASMKSVWG